VNRDNTLLRWLPRLVVGACGALALTAPSALAQKKEPAATLLPARPAPAPVVARGSTPDTPLPAFTGAYVPSVPAPNYGGNRNDPSSPKGSWVGTKWGGLKDSVFGKPNPAEAKTLDPDPRLLAAPTNPLLGTGSPVPVPPQPSQNVYASPPAYRWYGWGGTTPGANPHSPSGVYPQGSANWYSQTGATPGAFPVALKPATPEGSAAEPPAYSRRATSEPPLVVGVPAKPSPPLISGPQVPEPRVVARTAIGPAADFEMPTSPRLPSGTPHPIASSAEGRPVTPEPASPPPTELNWQSAGGRGVPMPRDLEPLPAPSRPAAPETDWTSVRPATTRPKSVTPTVSVIRGQIDGSEVRSLEALVHNAVTGRVVRTEVRGVGGKRLVVTFVAASEAAAREAAALVVKLPELKPYSVTFEAHIAPR